MDAQAGIETKSGSDMESLLARGKEVGLAVAKDKRGKFPMMIRARQIR
jgi:hypothetical protein